jgi:hypothetical protein
LLSEDFGDYLEASFFANVESVEEYV